MAAAAVVVLVKAEEIGKEPLECAEIGKRQAVAAMVIVAVSRTLRALVVVVPVCVSTLSRRAHVVSELVADMPTMMVAVLGGARSRIWAPTDRFASNFNGMVRVGMGNAAGILMILNNFSF